MHDAVRIRQLESGVPRRVAAALRQHGTVNDDVLWAALFTLAVLVRDDSAVFGRAASALVAAGVFKVGTHVLTCWRLEHLNSSTYILITYSMPTFARTCAQIGVHV